MSKSLIFTTFIITYSHNAIKYKALRTKNSMIKKLNVGTAGNFSRKMVLSEINLLKFISNYNKNIKLNNFFVFLTKLFIFHGSRTN